MSIKNSKLNKEIGPVWFILFSATLITLYFNPSLQDPFNSPKFWLLILTGSWLAGYLIFQNQKNLKMAKNKSFNLLISGFVIAMLTSALLTENKFTAFFGDSGRRLGFLTYLFLAIFMLASFKYFSVHSLNKIYFIIFFISLLSFFYALMQTTGNDFATWANPYNSIIGTLGNPNFASSAMAVYSIMSFSAIFIKSFSKIYRISNFFIVIGLILLIIKSDSRQGLVVFAVGVAVVSTILLDSKNKILGLVSLISVLCLSLFAVLGMLQIGPFQQYLYKESVTVRGYYWDAAIKMFKNNPLFGVGIDEYGLFFKQFRDLQYPLNYGFEITSSNAHNIPLQLISTGGIFVGIFYLALIAFIIVKSIQSLNCITSEFKLLYAGLFAAWLGFQAQSIISIENIGLGVWNWVLGGVLLKISNDVIVSNNKLGQMTKNYPANINQLKSAQPVISGIFTLLTIILVANLYTGEMDTMKSRSFYDYSKQAQSREFYFFSEKAIDNNFNDPYYKLIVIEMLLQSDDHAKAMKYLLKLHENDPDNLDFLRPLAIVSEQDGDKLNAIKYRKIMEPLDPWNLDNYLRLGYLYRDMGDISNMQKMLAKITSISPNHMIATTARQQLRS